VVTGRFFLFDPGKIFVDFEIGMTSKNAVHCLHFDGRFPDKPGLSRFTLVRLEKNYLG